MKKIVEKNKKIRSTLKIIEKQHFILKAIFKNFNYFILVRWNAFLKLKILTTNSSNVSILNKCLYTKNKKRFNKLTMFSRYVFLKQIRSGNVIGMQKASW